MKTNCSMGNILNMTRAGLAAIMVASACFAACAVQAGQAGLIEIRGAIGPATATYIARAIDTAAARGDECLIIELDTPGGLLESTKEIVQKLFTDALPTIVYVEPSGANAASAGTFITLAANIAAMAPNTTIGAAHPVSTGGLGDSGEKTDDTMKQKLENYASSYIEAIAVKRNHNIEWAKSAVRESASITSEQALKETVIDLIATNLPDLLSKIDGRKIGGRTFHTAGIAVVKIPMVLHERVFQLLWRPEVMFVLMLIAIYGIIGEISNPGAILPGVVGAIALVVVLYMSAILPVNIAGVVLILLAVAMFIIDVYATTHGVLTAGGIIAFFLGSIMLFNRAPGFGLSLSVVIPATVVTALFFILIVGAGLRAQLLPARTGREGMLGKTATALSEVNRDGGRVFVEGESWSALSDEPIAPGRPAEIIAVKGLTLHVKPKT
jgi:membrane-bound serine protease (ClpP class)